jgi:hypothetical protein
LKNLFALNPDIRAYGMQRLFPDRNLEEEKERNTDGKLCMEYLFNLFIARLHVLTF